MLSLSGELTVAIRNGLKRSVTKLVGKEDLAKLEKQLDDAVIEENGKKESLQRRKNAIKKELYKVLGEGGIIVQN
jgi:5S rRNA maturation endonuclease (ribonuclease M5)